MKNQRNNILTNQDTSLNVSFALQVIKLPEVERKNKLIYHFKNKLIYHFKNKLIYHFKNPLTLYLNNCQFTSFMF